MRAVSVLFSSSATTPRSRSLLDFGCVRVGIATSVVLVDEASGTMTAQSKAAQASPSGRRGHSRLYVEPRMGDNWDLAVIVVTLASLAIIGVEALFDVTPQVSSILFWADSLACVLFIVDFLWRLARAPRRVEFVRRNWVDLAGSIPAVGPLRTIRVVRLVRLLRLTSVWRRLTRRWDVPLPTGVLTSIVIVTIVMWVISASAFYELEAEMNGNITTFSDALWWSITTLSTVGYGDLYPETLGGRVVAVFTMVLGIGLLGAVAATTATVFVDFKDRGRRGLRRYVMRDHMLVLGWNDKARTAIQNFLADPRHEATDVVVVAELETAPVDDPRVRFVRGMPGKADPLERSSASKAGAAIVLARDPSDPRSDHETALIVTALRRINERVRIGVELVDSENAEHLTHAGSDAVIDKETTVANLLVRAVQDIGVSDVVTELLSSAVGSALYRAPIDPTFTGGSYRDYCVSMIDLGCSVIGVVRGHANLVNPGPDTVIEKGDEAFVIAKEPPLL
jgi:voltage-gated potassium channel